MRRLSSIDAAFWFAETDQFPPSGASLMICDTSDAPDFSFDAVRNLLAVRLQELPPLRYRVAGARLGFDKPWFVEDPAVDIDYHVRRIAVPAPGGRRELYDLVGRLLSYPLDRRRPLWEFWVIEGADHDRVAFLMKIHHALVDGESGAALFQAMFGHPAETRAPRVDGRRVPSSPGLPRLHRRALAALVNLAIMTPYRLLRLARQALSQRRAARRLDRPPRLFEAPITRFNGQISTQRRVSASRLPLDRIQAVKCAFGVKFNDVVLALASAAVRRYLHDRGELPERPLIAQIGVSTRAESTTVGNQITSATIRLATDVADPVERLQSIHRSTQAAKEWGNTMAAHQVMARTEAMPPCFWALAVRSYTRSGIGKHVVPVNMAVSTIRGSDSPLHVVGAVVERMVPLGPLSINLGLDISCHTYNGWVEFGVVTTPEIAMDVDDLADAIEPSLRELEEAAHLHHRYV
ncbi:diacylglycerol O-acyltransferase [Mycobacterium sp. GA-1285]|uniref:WS/DGAT/MGAT family O-acyltransferase n=1 Tax=Mycobacterium sp. GA-1285 TaxID=1772282 RepID=UPI00074906FF|nr:wax ester/triacylglycerol synthase family O-acyltransferase [Mycobacterium sp. GA-1285]KUI15292.1 diacylglycerol O-acyltransferase [Mycobacterium sp. GA-1285]